MAMTTPDLSHSTHSTPERSLEQRLGALQRANAIRVYRARMKRDVKHGERDLLAVLREPPPEVDTMKVAELLRASPKYGRVKTQKMLHRCKISTSKTVGGLSERQRVELVAAMRQQVPYGGFRR